MRVKDVRIGQRVTTIRRNWEFTFGGKPEQVYEVLCLPVPKVYRITGGYYFVNARAADSKDHPVSLDVTAMRLVKGVRP